MIIGNFSSFLTDTLKCVKCPTSRIDCETNFLSILDFFFQSGCIFAGNFISAVYNVPTSPCMPASYFLDFFLRIPTGAEISSWMRCTAVCPSLCLAEAEGGGAGRGFGCGGRVRASWRV